MLRPDYPLLTERLLLRPFETGDLEELFAYQSLPEVARFLYWEPRDLEESRVFLQQKMAASTLGKEGDWLVMAVVDRADGRLMGEINLRWHSREHRQGELGYLFHPDFHGHGYATEAAEVGLRLGFEVLGLHRVTGRLDARNDASARVLERLGMRREAHLRENEFVKGEWSDEIVYAMLRREWDARRPGRSAAGAGVQAGGQVDDGAAQRVGPPDREGHAEPGEQ